MGATGQFLAALILLVAPAVALAGSAVGFEDARHLLNRTDHTVTANRENGALLAQPFRLQPAESQIASKAGVAVVKISHNGFDTHSNQQNVHARLLKELAEGMVAMRAAMQEIERWESTLMMTYAEFGRRPKENQSAGTDHGTANAHFVLGGRVRGRSVRRAARAGAA